MNPKKISLLRFSRDKKEVDLLFKELNFYKDYLKVTVEALVAHRINIHRSKGMKLSPYISPRIFSLIEDTQEKLGTELKFDVYCNNDLTINCEISRNNIQGNFCSLFVNSATLEQLTDSELMFVIGHELGHRIFEHDLLHTFFHFYDFGKLKIHVPFSAKCKYLRWRPASEITADRIGLYLCGDLRSACSAILKAGLGLSEKNLNTDLKSLFSFIEEDFSSDKTSYKNRSHPSVPMRLMSIKYFWDWYCYGDNFDASLKENLDDKVESFLKLSYRESNGEIDEAMATFLATKGLELIEADSKILSIELDTLIYTLFDNFTLSPENYIEWDKSKREKKIKNSVKIINKKGTDSQKKFLLKKIIQIATCDHDYSQEEKQIVYKIVESFGLQDSSF